jgi:hypothetical protein
VTLAAAVRRAGSGCATSAERRPAAAARYEAPEKAAGQAVELAAVVSALPLPALPLSALLPSALPRPARLPSALA